MCAVSPTDPCHLCPSQRVRDGVGRATRRAQTSLVPPVSVLVSVVWGGGPEAPGMFPLLARVSSGLCPLPRAALHGPAHRTPLGRPAATSWHCAWHRDSPSRLGWDCCPVPLIPRDWDFLASTPSSLLLYAAIFSLPSFTVNAFMFLFMSI